MPGLARGHHCNRLGSCTIDPDEMDERMRALVVDEQVDPWHSGGRIVPSDCQVLCISARSGVRRPIAFVQTPGEQLRERCRELTDPPAGQSFQLLGCFADAWREFMNTFSEVSASCTAHADCRSESMIGQ